MKISVITVSFNSEKYIRHTIESILQQTYQNYEYIIIDGGSTDGTINIVKEYETNFNGKLKWISEKDHGIYDAMNKGINLCSGEIIGILNSDDWYEKDTVENIARLFTLEPNTDIVHGKVNIVDFSGKFIKEMYLKENAYDFKYSEFMPIFHPTAFVKRDVYTNIGLFNTKYKIAADYDFILRGINNKLHIAFVNKVITNFRDSGISSKRVYLSYWEATRVNIDNGVCRIKAYYIFISRSLKYFIYSKLGNTQLYKSLYKIFKSEK